MHFFYHLRLITYFPPFYSFFYICSIFPLFSLNLLFWLFSLFVLIFVFPQLGFEPVTLFPSVIVFSQYVHKQFRNKEKLEQNNTVYSTCSLCTLHVTSYNIYVHYAHFKLKWSLVFSYSLYLQYVYGTDSVLLKDVEPTVHRIKRLTLFPAVVGKVIVTSLFRYVTRYFFQ